MRATAIALLCLGCMGHARRVQTRAAFNPSSTQVSQSAPVSSGVPVRAGTSKMETVADLEVLAKQLNPFVGFWDPLQIANYDQFRKGEEASVGFLRHAELKHGRVAMAAFIGYIVQANGFFWPGKLTLAGKTFADISAAGSPPDQWDALPTGGKLQILLFIGLLEWLGEWSPALEQAGMKHYMKGGKPGSYPPLENVKPGGVRFPLNLFDPFDLQKDMTPERKEKALLAEINNGRLAMLGIMAFLAEAKVPGSVPLLSSIVKPYAGEPMAPFTANDASLPFVTKMLETKIF
mmetsp:Transcript_33317/g.60762  ORF Transcript_33317/g.60762 Transcript_33317/m.60762 type:complete len:291 (-) Transcript_33317:79-951(-)